VHFFGTKKIITLLVLTRGTDLVYRSLVNPQQVSTNFNKYVGGNIQLLRKARGMSQADLARELTARGYSFQHQGVLKLEGGARPLRFEEAFALAEILGVTPDQLADRPAGAAAAAKQLLQVHTNIADVEQRIAELQHDLEHLASVKADAERRLAAAGAVKGPDGLWRFGDADG
jgi:transcriptional regulator with XRE-family HTH domain